MCIFLKTCYIVFKNIMEELKNLLDCALTFVVYNTMKHKPLRCITKWHLIICVGTCRKRCFLIMDKHHQCSWKPPLSHHGSKSKFHEALICMESIATPLHCHVFQGDVDHSTSLWNLASSSKLFNLSTLRKCSHTIMKLEMTLNETSHRLHLKAIKKELQSFCFQPTKKVSYNVSFWLQFTQLLINYVYLCEMNIQ